jgi:predicted porin
VTIDNDTFASDDVTQFKYYVHLQYKLHKNLVIRPEIGFIDYADDQYDAEAGSSFQVGLRFQFVF